MAADAIGASEIAADAIGASEIAANAVGASEVADNAIAVEHIAASAIGASEIAADAIGASEIAADAITASEIAADAITAAELATNAIGADEFAGALRRILADSIWGLDTSLVDANTAGIGNHLLDSIAGLLARIDTLSFLSGYSFGSTSLTKYATDRDTVFIVTPNGDTIAYWRFVHLSDTSGAPPDSTEMLRKP